MRYHSSLEVDLGSLRENFQLLKEKAPKNKIIFMVKANAYGHGLLPVSKFAHEEGLCEVLGVASLGEAVEIRKKLPSLKKEIFVFSDTGLMFPESVEKYVDYGVTPVISHLEDLKTFLSHKYLKNFPLVLKVDTGMHRLGVAPGELEEIVKTLKLHGKRTINHLMTHFSSSYIPLRDGDKTHRQYEAFLRFKNALRDHGIEIEETSCANSGAIEQSFSLEESHIRPGLMLYGPSSSGLWSGKIISSLKTYIMKTMPVRKGSPIGYGNHVVHQDGLLAYVPLGYGDGLLTSYTKMEIEIAGLPARLLGRVNMDLAAFLFNSEAARKIKRGLEVNLWDHDPEILCEISRQTNVIPYQIFTSISGRVPRRYTL